MEKDSAKLLAETISHYFEKQKKWKCFVFLNEKPKFKWNELEMLCEASEHK